MSSATHAVERPVGPGPALALAMTVTSALAVYFWWSATYRLVPHHVTFALAILGGRGLVAWLAARDLGPNRAQLLGLRWPEPRAWAWTPLLVPALFLGLAVTALGSRLAGGRATAGLFEVAPGYLRTDGALDAVLCVIGVVLVVPAATELLFRGLLQGGLVARLGAWKGVVATIVLAGVAHVALLGPRPADVPAALVAACGWAAVLGVARQWGGSLACSFAVHAGMSLALLAALFASASWPVAGVNSPAHSVPLPLVSGSALSVALGLALAWRWRPT